MTNLEITAWLEPKPATEDTQSKYWVLRESLNAAEPAKWVPRCDFLNDLNAWVEVYRVLEDRGLYQEGFVNELDGVLVADRNPPDDEFGAYDGEFVKATARQRGEALARMLEKF